MFKAGAAVGLLKGWYQRGSMWAAFFSLNCAMLSTQSTALQVLIPNLIQILPPILLKNGIQNPNLKSWKKIVSLWGRRILYICGPQSPSTNRTNTNTDTDTEFVQSSEDDDDE